MESTEYVHGYTEREALRLNDQAATLDDIIHNDSIFTKDSLVHLESKNKNTTVSIILHVACKTRF